MEFGIWAIAFFSCLAKVLSSFLGFPNLVEVNVGSLMNFWKSLDRGIMAISELLDKADIEKLTGTKVRKLQIEHLVKSNIAFWEDRNGYPQVFREPLIQASVGGYKKKKDSVGVNLSHLQKSKEIKHG
jgi:hypothetical protein